MKKLWLRIEEQQMLLNSALHDLAIEAERSPRIPGESFSREGFINRWYRKHRGSA